MKNVDCFTACFDESLNHNSNRKQMNVHLMYFDSAENGLVRPYIRSSCTSYGNAIKKQ